MVALLTPVRQRKKKDTREEDLRLEVRQTKHEVAKSRTNYQLKRLQIRKVEKWKPRQRSDWTVK